MSKLSGFYSAKLSRHEYSLILNTQLRSMYVNKQKHTISLNNKVQSFLRCAHPNIRERQTKQRLPSSEKIDFLLLMKFLNIFKLVSSRMLSSSQTLVFEWLIIMVPVSMFVCSESKHTNLTGNEKNSSHMD